MRLNGTHPTLSEQLAHGFRVMQDGTIQALTKIEAATLIARALNEATRTGLRAPGTVKQVDNE